MNYEVINLNQKIFVGLTARTGNIDPDGQRIIGGLWQDFMGKGILDCINNKANAYCVGLYSNYGLSNTEYDVTIGAEVYENENPELTAKIIPAGRYAKFHVKGDVVKDVGIAWQMIWDMPLERSFTGDYEEYISNINGVAEIDIYVALK